MAGLLLDRVLNSLDASGQSVKHLLDISTLLHGDYSQLVFLVDPGKEGLVLVMEDSTAFGPVSLHTSNLKIWISGNEEEVVINELLSNLLSHSREGKV